MMEEKALSLVCKRCGRKLKTADSQQLGYGKICYEKMKAKGKSLLERTLEAECLAKSGT